jgi:hypothetical protein
MVMKKLEKVRPFFNIYKHSNVLFVYILLKKIVIKKKSIIDGACQLSKYVITRTLIHQK